MNVTDTAAVAPGLSESLETLNVARAYWEELREGPEGSGNDAAAPVRVFTGRGVLAARGFA